MRVKWTEYARLSSIPESYWGEDLTQLDWVCEGEVIGTTMSFWGTTYLTVGCTDGKIRQVEAGSCSIVNK